MNSVLPFVAQVICWGLFFYKWIIIVAVIFTWVSADRGNPVVQWINRVTWPFWRWCGRWIPAAFQSFNAYVSLLLVIFLQAVIPATVNSANHFLDHQTPSVFLTQIGGHLLQGGGIVVQSVLMFLIFLLVVWFILGIVNASINNPVVQVIHFLIDPIITPLQHYLPRTKTDLSPLVATGLFFLFNSILIQPLLYYGASLSFPIPLCVF